MHGFYHIGICVQDLAWTLGFFERVLQAELIDLSPRDPANQAFVTGVDGIEVQIAYIRCQGLTIELMEYRGTARLQHFSPRMVDSGHFHLCFRVPDVTAMVAACRAYDSRIKTLSPGPLIVDSGPNRGNGVILVVLPDGMMLEFSGSV